MADRDASAAVLAELAAAACQPVHLFELVLDAATVRNCDAYRDIVFGGNTFIANGHFMAFDAIEESADLTISRVTVQLSGIDQTWVASVLAHTYVDRVLRIYKGFLDAAGALIVDPILIFDGRVDAPSIEEDPDSGKSSVALSATSQWVDFERRPGRHTNDAEQQFHFPGDRGFEFVARINRQAVWGRP